MAPLERLRKSSGSFHNKLQLTLRKTDTLTIQKRRSLFLSFKDKCSDGLELDGPEGGGLEREASRETKGEVGVPLGDSA